MAIAYNSVAYRGKAAEPIVEEILFENETIAKGLVTFETDVKAETIFTEAKASATLQAYTSGAPTSAGSLEAFDVVVTPTKVQFYQEFDPNSLRFSRFKRDMKPGAWEIMSDEFEKVVIGGLYAKQVSLAAENEFWNGVTAATKTAVAALTAGTGQTSVGAAEKTLVAALTASQTDGIVAKMIYNDSNDTATAGVGGRVKVVGTTVTSANIKAEYDKIYDAIPAVVLAGSEQPVIYAPKSHKQMIIAANNVTTDYTKPFDVDASAKNIFFNGLRVEFVPVPEKVAICALPSHLIWATDLESDINLMQIEKIANNREDMFIKNNMTIAAHVVNQKFNVLYVG
jgi:predicted ABC-type ATPase